MRPAAGVLLADPSRLAAVDRTLAVAVAAREALDRLAGLAAVVMDAPVGVVNLVGAEQQHLVGSAGMGEPLSSSRQASVQTCYCPVVVLAGEPLFLEDAAADAEFAGYSGYAALGFHAYAGVPLRDADGQLVGTLFVADTRPHRWERAARDALVALARSVVAELALYQDMKQREQLLAAFEAAPAAITVKQTVHAEPREAEQARELVAAEHAARQAAEAAADRLRGIVGGLAAIVWEAPRTAGSCGCTTRCTWSATRMARPASIRA